MIDVDAMKTIATELYTPMVVSQHGDAGGQALRRILYALDVLYRHVPPESCKGPVIVFSPLEDSSGSLLGSPDAIINQPDLISQEYCQAFALQVQPDKSWFLWKRDDIDPQLLAEKAVVYQFLDRREYFYAKSEKRLVPNPHPAYHSCFAIPTFDNLMNALVDYSSRVARYSSCPTLIKSWFDANRIFLKNAQEHTMRDSLTHALKLVIRNAEVRPEQNVDASKPVDIKVTWTLTNRRAIIEIKWVGKSIHTTTGKIANDYTDVRARDGAKQLADYLDMNKQQSPSFITRGYLVVFDARRAKTDETTTVIDKAKGLSYRDKDLKYNPDYHLTRDDFEKPIRMFMEPICQ